ncbi:MAG TPA: nucleoside-diphosphate kinase [Nitrospinota bacterium]|nr:nucleoside-diphosphate kinase [Nitrospinota bacterium]
MEKTLAIIKPDAMRKKMAGKIIDRIYEKGFNIVGLKMLQLKENQANEFYKVHAERPFYKDLVSYMTSGSVIVAALEKENAIKDWRNLMGATNPAEAAEGTIRKDFGENIEANAVHGSDSPETASTEVPFFFAD